MEYSFITSASDLCQIAERISRVSVLGLDVETTSLDPRHGQIRLVQVIVPGKGNDGRGDIFVIDLFKTGGLGPILRAFVDTKAIFVVHNAKFEQKWFWWKYRIRLWPVFCTMRASALIYNGKRGLRYDLDSVVSRELNEISKNTGQGSSNWAGILTQVQRDYAAEDVLRLLSLRDVLKSKLASHGLLTAALIEFGVLFAEGRVELNGLPIDRERWLALADANRIERDRMRESLLYELPHPVGQMSLPGMSCAWNVNSSQQMLKSLKKLGLKISGTEEIELAQYVVKYPVVKSVIDYRHIDKRVSTYGEGFLRHVDSDGRIHPDYYGQLVTGRYSANKSLQQIPGMFEFRDCFRPPDGRWLVGCDYSGVEMRLCAEISGDPVLIQVFVDGLDAHRATAAVIVEIRVEDVTKEQRSAAKPVNFGLIYGMMPDKLVLYAMSNYGVILSLSDAKMYRKRYFEQYKGIERWHKRVLREGKRCGASRTLSGRIRYLDASEAHNEYYNTPIQGTGADMLKTGLAIVQDKVDDVFGVTPKETPDGPVAIDHHVHDEIILECDEDPEMIKECENLLASSMKQGMEKFVRRVPAEVDCSNGRSWAEIH